MTESQTTGNGSLSEALRIMSTMSDRVIDTTITPRLAALAENPDPYELERIIDECVYSSLCAGSIIIAMQCIRDALKQALYP